MGMQHVLTILLLVLPTQLTGITTTHHDKKTDPKSPIIVAEMVDQMPEEKSNSSDSAERQRRLIPYMTFYLTRDFNRPAGPPGPRQQQYHLVPQKLNAYPDKYIVTTNYQPKYADTPPVLYQPKITYTPFLESNKLPGGFTPMHTSQPIRVQVIRGPQQQQQQQQVEEPNYSSIFDKLLQLKQAQQPSPQYVVPQYQAPKLNIATQYFTRNYGTPRPPSKVVTYENYQSEPVQESPRYKPIPAKTFIHTYTPANIDITGDNKVQNYENFESLKTYTQIPSPVGLNDQGVKTYTQISPEEYAKSQGSGEQRPVKVYQTVNQKIPDASVVPIKLYQDEYQKPLGQNRPVAVPVKLYQTVNQDNYQKLPSHNQPTLPVKVYQSVTQDNYQNAPSPASVKVYQSLPPVTVDEYQAGNQDEYQKPQSRPVKVYQPIYPSEFQQPDLQVKAVTPVKAYQSVTEEKYQKPQQPVGAVYQTINQDVYQQQQPQQEQAEAVDSKPSEVVSKPGVKVYQSDFSQSPQGSGNPIVLRPVYRPVKPYQPDYPEATTEAQTLVATENPHSLSVILKQLQDSNTLPQTLTPDNIDNSIKTLVHILNALKHTQKFQRPIVVAQPGSDEEEGVHEGNEEEDYEDALPETVSQNFPANTVEGGTPGKPGVDYPAHAQIPETSFNCKKQRYKGFFGDPDTNCQVWHYCDLNGGQASFLCPNGTIFSQVALTCDWWYNVKCATTTQLYVLNERLYKYILPFTPKFPEDYSGPLVDRYLALKFKEMEEKMKKQKKGKPAKPAEDVQDHERNTLQDIEDESGGAETQEHTTIVPAPDEKKSN